VLVVLNFSEECITADISDLGFRSAQTVFVTNVSSHQSLAEVDPEPFGIWIVELS
jgi:hypothetical protein